jgi:hypothetical protein
MPDIRKSIVVELMAFSHSHRDGDDGQHQNSNVPRLGTLQFPGSSAAESQPRSLCTPPGP